MPGIYSTELVTYVNQVGIKPLDALRWATRNVADLLGMAGELGTVVGRRVGRPDRGARRPIRDITLLAGPGGNAAGGR